MEVDDNISEEEKYRLMKMYEISKGVVIDYILNIVNSVDGFVKGSYSEIFAFDHTYNDTYREPLVLNTQNKNEYVRVDYELLDSYKFELDDVELTNLIYQVSIELVNLGFQYIVEHMVVDEANKALLSTINFCVDSKTGMLVPISISTNRRRMLLLNEHYEELKRSEISNDFGVVQKMIDGVKADLDEVSKQCTLESDEFHRQLTLTLMGSKNIYPVCKKITSDDVPQNMKAKIIA